MPMPMAAAMAAQRFDPHIRWGSADTSSTVSVALGDDVQVYRRGDWNVDLALQHAQQMLRVQDRQLPNAGIGGWGYARTRMARNAGFYLLESTLRQHSNSELGFSRLKGLIASASQSVQSAASAAVVALFWEAVPFPIMPVVKSVFDRYVQGFRNAGRAGHGSSVAIANIDPAPFEKVAESVLSALTDGALLDTSTGRRHRIFTKRECKRLMVNWIVSRLAFADVLTAELE